MIKELTLVCGEITMIETNRTLHGNVQVTLNNVDTGFLPDVEAEEIVNFQDVDMILEAIGVEEVAEWLKEKGAL